MPSQGNVQEAADSGEKDSHEGDLPRAKPDAGESVPGDVPFSFLHGIVYALNGLYGRAYQQLHQHTPCPLPPRGPALIAANHTAGLDPSIIQAACTRRIMWLMTREFYDLPQLQWFFRWTDMIPIQVSGRDSRAWREAIRQLRLGRIVGVFPEGRIERRRELMPFQTGVALLAIRGEANIYPVYVDGRQRNSAMLHSYLVPQHPSIAWGQPISVARTNPNRQTLRALTDQLEARMRHLQDRYPAPRRRGKSLLEP